MTDNAIVGTKGAKWRYILEDSVWLFLMLPCWCRERQLDMKKKTKNLFWIFHNFLTFQRFDVRYWMSVGVKKGFHLSGERLSLSSGEYFHCISLIFLEVLNPYIHIIKNTSLYTHSLLFFRRYSFFQTISLIKQILCIFISQCCSCLFISGLDGSS